MRYCGRRSGIEIESLPSRWGLAPSDRSDLPDGDREEFSKPSFATDVSAGLLPLFPLILLAVLRPFIQPRGDEWRDFNQMSVIYSILYGGLILRTVVFFGSAWIFMNLFRGELVDRSLHYYFLSAVRWMCWWWASTSRVS